MRRMDGQDSVASKQVEREFEMQGEVVEGEDLIGQAYTRPLSHEWITPTSYVKALWFAWQYRVAIELSPGTTTVA